MGRQPTERERALGRSIAQLAETQGVSLAAVGAALTSRRPAGVSREMARRLLTVEPQGLTAADLLDLARLLGPVVFQAMANTAEVSATVMHGAIEASPATAQQAVCKAQVASARAMVSYAEAAADGAVTPSEAVEVRARCREACTAWHLAAQAIASI